MTAPQTSVASRRAAVPGQLHGSGHVIEPCTSTEASAGIPAGVMIKNAGLLLTATDNALLGVPVFNHYYNRESELDSDGYQPKATFGLLRKGRISVLLEENVAVGDPVRVRAVVAGAEQAGAFRTSADGTDCIDISAFASWRTAGSAGGTAELEVDMTNASLAEADV